MTDTNRWNRPTASQRRPSHGVMWEHRITRIGLNSWRQLRSLLGHATEYWWCYIMMWLPFRQPLRFSHSAVFVVSCNFSSICVESLTWLCTASVAEQGLSAHSTCMSVPMSPQGFPLQTLLSMTSNILQCLRSDCCHFRTLIYLLTYLLWCCCCWW